MSVLAKTSVSQHICLTQPMLGQLQRETHIVCGDKMSVVARTLTYQADVSSVETRQISVLVTAYICPVSRHLSGSLECQC